MKLTVAAAAMASTATIALGAITPEMLTAIAPSSGSCESEQCRTAVQVAPLLDAAFAKWGITSPTEMAAAVALMALESGEFKYNRNAFPGRPGQGTANMQMPNFNVQYAAAIAAADPSEQATVDGLNLPAPEAAESASPELLESMMVFLTQDKYNFGSAAWFMTTQCADARAAFANDADAGWAAYLACIHVDAVPERDAYWQSAKQAFAGYQGAPAGPTSAPEPPVTSAASEPPVTSAPHVTSAASEPLVTSAAPPIVPSPSVSVAPVKPVGKQCKRWTRRTTA